MKLLVVDDLYPAPGRLYADLFVHTRVQAYRSHFEEVRVVASFWEEGPNYSFEGVEVVRAGSHDRLAEIAHDYAPDAILVHFATFHVIRKLIERVDAPYIVWSHGFDAVGWWRRLYQWRPIGPFLRYVVDNMAQRWFYRRLLKRANRTRRIAMVFVSSWLARIAQADSGVRLAETNVIPNPIDTGRFGPRPKAAGDRFRWLAIRPASKSGFDILTDALAMLSKEDWFEQVQMTFVGEGIRGSRFDRLLGHLPNITTDNRAVTQDEIVGLHRRHGLFLSPTRQDSHGVSACEAMASGLVVVTCNNSAVPEFVDDGITGVVTSTDARSYANALRDLIHNPDHYQAMANAAPPAIRQSCGIEGVIAREVALIRDVVSRS